MPSTPPPSTHPSPETRSSNPSARPFVRRLARPRRRMALVLAAGAGMATVTALTAAEVVPAADAVTTGHEATPTDPGDVPVGPVATDPLAAPPAAGPADSGGTVHAASVSAPVPADPTTGQPADGSSTTPGTDLGTFTVTCYAIHGRTASGEEAGPQSVAVDPSVIPLGTDLFIDGVGYRTADDTGGAVRGRHIDIWEATTSACETFGVQYEDVRRVS